MANDIRQAIFALLAYRDYTQYEVTQKLRAKKFPTHEIELAIADFAQNGYLNDNRFAENFIRSRQSKGYGPERIAMELSTHGIREETIAELLNFTDNVWHEAARKIWLKRFKNSAPKTMQEKAKQMRFLQYRGFTRDQIESLLRDE